MVPIAGDEITETISDKYLLDFKIAEEAKRNIVNEQSATIEDILGFEATITYEECLPQIIESVDRLASLLAQEVRNLNAKTPQAVMLIGGGSLTPKITDKLAEYLQLPTNRVARRGIEAIQFLEKNEALPTGPDFVTPVGIAISAKQNPLHYITVYVNDKITLMFETKQLTVGDCLIQAGIEVNKFYGKIGLASIIKVNGEKMTLRGEYGEAPTIYVNGTEATVDSPIESGDKIEIYKGKDGTNPVVTMEDIAGKMVEIPFEFNGEKFILQPTYKVNGQSIDQNYILQDKDNIIIQTAKTIADFLDSNRHLAELAKPFFVTVNEQSIKLDKGNATIFVNDQPASLQDTINENDKISIVYPEKGTVKTLLNQLDKQYMYRIEVTFNGQPVVLTQEQLTVTRNEMPLDLDSELYEGDQLSFISKKLRPFIFQDVFRYVEIDLTQTKGNYKLYKNDEESFG